MNYLTNIKNYIVDYFTAYHCTYCSKKMSSPPEGKSYRYPYLHKECNEEREEKCQRRLN